MSSSSEEDCKENTIFYKDKPLWSDIKPIPQDDGDEPVIAIDYSLEFKDVFGYFRAIVEKGEKSERALELTCDAVRLNAANYTVWQYRREILKALKKDIYEELDFIEDMILNQSKNYQVWQHRRILVEWIKDASKEKYLTERVLSKDAKNYHAWQHRQWALKIFNLYDGELEYVDALISDDVRNNSAWNQRYFIFNNTSGFTEDVINSEIEYALRHILLVTENESSWNYLRGLLIQNQSGLSENKRIALFCEDLYKSGNRSQFLQAAIVDMCMEEVSKGNLFSQFTAVRGKQLCKDLATTYDVIRANYWKYISSTFIELDDASGDKVQNDVVKDDL